MFNSQKSRKSLVTKDNIYIFTHTQNIRITHNSMSHKRLSHTQLRQSCVVRTQSRQRLSLLPSTLVVTPRLSTSTLRSGIRMRHVHCHCRQNSRTIQKRLNISIQDSKMDTFCGPIIPQIFHKMHGLVYKISNIFPDNTPGPH